jgi:hypothetical protein
MTAVITGPKPSHPAGVPDSAGSLQNNIRELGCAHDLPSGCRAVVDSDATVIFYVPTAKRVSPFKIGPMPVSTPVKHSTFTNFLPRTAPRETLCSSRSR